MATFFVSWIWCPLAITILLDYDFLLFPFGPCFVVIGGTRTMLLCAINKVVEEEADNYQLPTLPDVVMEAAIKGVNIINKKN